MGKTAIIKGSAIFYFFYYLLKTNKTPNKLHTFNAFQTYFKSVKSIKCNSQKQWYQSNIIRSAYLRCFILKGRKSIILQI